LIRFFILLTVLISTCLHGQRQYSDTLYLPPTFTPRYVDGGGPLVWIDETHNNFHTRNGRYRPFSNVLIQDGFKVASFTGSTDEAGLKGVNILVIANALPDSSLEGWEAPTASAFTPAEVKALRSWVDKGGSLFLIADHMPMGGAAKQLAQAFGFTFFDSFSDNQQTDGGIEIFKYKDGSLQPSMLTSGKNGYLKVKRVATFTGQAFQIPEGATDILHCGPGWISRFPQVAWQFNENTRQVSSDGWSQGAYLKIGKGKIVCFGEAAMFSAQILEVNNQTFKAGMNQTKVAKHNYRLLLNIMRWLGE
jgi:hypothetical protein